MEASDPQLIPDLKIGSRVVSVSRAVELLLAFTDPCRRFAFHTYDQLETPSGPYKFCEADLFAPRSMSSAPTVETACWLTAEAVPVWGLSALK